MRMGTRSGVKTSRRKTARLAVNRRSQIVRTFIEILNVVKLYHWKTRSYAEHKATDELYERLNENIDKFVEVYLGKDESRIKYWERRVEVVQPENKTEFKAKIYQYRDFLKGLTRKFTSPSDSDLLSIRDDILSDINQFLYLLTFAK